MIDVCHFRWRQEGDEGGSHAGRRRVVARLLARPPGEAEQVRQVLVLVLLVSGSRGVRPPRHEGDRRPRVGRVPQHPAGEAHLERHGNHLVTNQMHAIFYLLNHILYYIKATSYDNRIRL